MHPRFIEDHLHNAKKNQVIAGKRVRLSQKFSQKIMTSNDPISPVSALFASESGHKNALRSNVLSHYLSKTNQNADSVFSCNFSFWRQDAINVNGFNCDFVGWGAEDKEFCIRLINDGASKKQLKHLAVCYHLYHPELSRKMAQVNQQIYDDAISKKLTYCRNGIKKYIPS
nr:hypothetical protein BCU57_18925 [Shewanella sp. 10N.286.48.B5]